MPYDKNLDECLFTKAWENDANKVSVNIYSYNKGSKKLQISREARDAQGTLKFAKLGRMTKEEVEGILPFIQEAIEKMD
ncbi:MAG: hypothetical protein PHV17_02930 [Candidatus Omnitrophica bacterium]|nr:hypothetical protein [Candidatus Omnitrophota bacterium]